MLAAGSNTAAHGRSEIVLSSPSPRSVNCHTHTFCRAIGVHNGMLSPHMAEGGVMPNLRTNSMALFGEIDRIAIEADKNPSAMNDAVLDAVESLLPNTTALGQRGWYGELQEFLNSPKVRANDPSARSANRSNSPRLTPRRKR